VLHTLILASPCRFPVAEHPVLALSGAPGSFPVAEHNRDLQRYFKWSQPITDLANNFIQEYIGDGTYVGVHLRMGSDWVGFIATIIGFIQCTLCILHTK